MSQSQIAQRFEKHIKEQNYKENTERIILSTIKKFYSFCEAENINIEQFSESDVKKYKQFLQKNLKNNAQLSCIQSLRKLIIFLGKDDLLGVASITRDYTKKHKILSSDDVENLLIYLEKLVASSENNYTDIRNVLGIKLILCCKNLRCNEMFSLKYDDFVLEGNEYVITFGNKKSKIKASFIEKELQILSSYKDLKDGYVFVSRNKNLLDSVTFNYNVTEIGKNVNIENLCPIDLKRVPFFI